MRNRSLPIFGAVLYFLYSWFFSDGLLISIVGISFTVFVFLDFVKKLGHTIPITELIVLIASLQWIVGASISYNIGVDHHRYYMYVNEATYMGYVVPSVIFLWLGFSTKKINLLKSKIESLFKNERARLKSQAIIFISIGLVAKFLGNSINAAALNFFFFLLSLVLFIGVIYLFFCFPKKKWIIFLITVGYLFVSSVRSGLFHDLLLVTVFLSFFLISERMSLLVKVLLLVISFSFAFTIQTVKSDLRAEVWQNAGNKNALDVFWNLVEEQFIQEPSSTLVSRNEQEDLEEANDANSRLNQGWIISKIMSNIPKNESYLGGETVLDAVSASFLPRFLFPDKKGAIGGIENFENITGLKLQKGTSMGLSITGEFYANFGTYGGWLAMFIYGWLISFFISWFIKNEGNGSPVVFIWLILLFYQVVKAETELIKIVNHLFKSLIVFYIIKIALSYINKTLLVKSIEKE